MRGSLPIFIMLFAIASCTSKTSYKEQTEIERQQENFEKIDFHSHYRYDRKCLDSLLQNWNMKAGLIEVAYEDSLENSLRWAALKEQYNTHPNTYFLCTSFAPFDIDSIDFASRTINKLKQDIEAGASMVKVWKNIGMVIRDRNEEFIQIDDQRLQPIWDYLAENNIPVLAHIGEPIQAWRPLEDGNPHYNYYKNNPEYHAFLHPEIPSWETIIASRDRWITNNPDLTIIAAHLGSMSHDVNLIVERLDKNPNLYVETAARFGDLAGQNSQVVRQFFIDYQDRILYGTDLGFSSMAKEDDPHDCDFAGSVISRHWLYLSSPDSLIYNSPMISFPIKTKGLGLPDSVLKKFYKTNATNILRNFN